MLRFIFVLSSVSLAAGVSKTPAKALLTAATRSDELAKDLAKAFSKGHMPKAPAKRLTRAVIRADGSSNVQDLATTEDASAAEAVAQPKCCRSKWGDDSKCGGYTGAGSQCNNDYTKTCTSDGDCSIAPTTGQAEAKCFNVLCGCPQPASPRFKLTWCSDTSIIEGVWSNKNGDNCAKSGGEWCPAASSTETAVAPKTNEDFRCYVTYYYNEFGCDGDDGRMTPGSWCTESEANCKQCDGVYCNNSPTTPPPSDANCRDDSSRRRSGYTCGQLAGVESGLWGGQDWNTEGMNHCGTLGNAKIEDNEGFTYCCATCKDAPQTIIYGGGEHTNNKFGSLMRPEALRSEQCTASSCEECSEPTSCWHGTSAVNTWENGDRVEINVDDDSSFASFAYEVHATCNSGAGTWHLSVTDLQNGVITLFLDYDTKPLHTFDSAEWSLEPMAEKLEIPVEQKTTHLRVVFTPSGKGARAKVWLYAKDVDAGVDDCMSRKNCVSVFGDNSDESFELRNVNQLQLKCLEGRRTGMSWKLKQKCKEWLTCLPEDEKPVLKALLRASGADSGPSSATEASEAQDPNTCIDPSVADPESWECSCLDNMVKQCGGHDETCFTKIMCDQPTICNTWKLKKCPTSFLASMFERGAYDKDAASRDLNTKVDDALLGKCLG